MKRNFAMLLSVVFLLIGLTACSSKSDMPMEIAVDGFTIVLGETVISELADQGYEIGTEGRPQYASDKQKYIPYYIRASKGAGEELFVGVYVPWDGDTQISKENNLAVTEGVIYSVKATPGSTKKIEAIYNGIEIKDLTPEIAMNDWAGKLADSNGSTSEKYNVEVKAGTVFIKCKKSNKELEEFQIELSYNEFLKMQK